MCRLILFWVIDFYHNEEPEGQRQSLETVLQEEWLEGRSLKEQEHCLTCQKVHSGEGQTLPMCFQRPVLLSENGLYT